MKKTTIIIILVLLLLTSNISLADKSISFKDISPTDWYNNTVTFLVKRGGIAGYPDGSFKPNNAITKAEFIKTLVLSLGLSDIKYVEGHWANGYIEKAEDINIIEKDWLKDIDKPISRYEMARVISNTLTYKKESTPSDIAKYKELITDFDKIPSTYNGETNGKSLNECVLEAFTKGIVTGYPNGTFQGGQTLTRAEASAVIVRVLDNSSRVMPEIKAILSFEEEVLRLVNIERNNASLNSLTLSKDLSKVALLKSEDMAMFNYFDHNSPNYGSPFEMMTEMGISYRSAGENIAKGYLTSEMVVEAWMNSPGHRANILSSLFSKMGVGVYQADIKSIIYWTQMFTN